MVEAAHPAMNAPAAAELGFGCARLLMQLGHAEAANLLDTALDAGIRHVDVARSYGDGRTEAVVGEVARRRRSQMKIVTKAGLFPPGLVSRGLRKAAALVDRDRNAPATRSFDPPRIRRSVEQSLRTLRTDHVDALLLHDCVVSDVSDDLRTLLEALKRSGLVLKVGVATSAKDASAVTASYPDLADVIQIDAASYDELKAPAGAQVITHSVFARRESNCEPAALLRDALVQNGTGVVLFSSTSASHIRWNATIARSLASSLPPNAKSRSANAA
jgi:D-threo-aldose 1-dehydrogenase